MKFKRVYHDYRTWEETHHNMWGESRNPKNDLAKAIEFTGDHALYGGYMMRVVKEWPISCENALTDTNINQKAWVGHAAVALALGIPEDITRKAWGNLTDEQRFLANQKAARAICYWRTSYRKDKDLHQDMGGPLLWPGTPGRGAA